MKTRNHSFKIGVWKAQDIKGETAVVHIDLQSNTCKYLWRSRYGFVFDGKHKKGGNSSVAYSSSPTRACPLFFSVTSVVAWSVFNPWQPFKSPCPCFQFIWSDTYFQKIIPSWKYHPKLDGWMDIQRYSDLCNLNFTPFLYNCDTTIKILDFLPLWNLGSKRPQKMISLHWEANDQSISICPHPYPAMNK